MPLKLLLHYLSWKTYIPHIIFFRLCLIGNMFLLHRSDIGHFYRSKSSTLNKQKLHVIRQTNPILRKLPRFAMFLTILFSFFSFTQVHIY